MAIVDMNRISIVGIESEKDKILKFIMKKGFVQIDDYSSDDSIINDEELRDALKKDSKDSKVIECEQHMSAISVAMDTIKSYVKIKKPMLSPKLDFKKITVSEAESLFNDIMVINETAREINNLKAEENSAANNRDILIPWKNFDLKLGALSTKYTKTILGTIPAKLNIDEVVTALSQEVPESLISVVNSDSQLVNVFVTVHNDCFDRAMEFLRNYMFSPVSFSEFTDTPNEEISNIDERMKQIQSEREKLIGVIKGYSSNMNSFENLYDYYMVLKDENKIVENLLKTKTTFCIKGWVPSKKSDEFIKSLTNDYDCYVETEKGDANEGFPVLLENNNFVTPFEDITNMYSTPSTRDIDPSGIMSFFYIIFFGMMLADAGYGILISVACFIAVKKLNLKKGQGNLLKLMAICGVSTTIWGFIFGSFFGVATPIIIINPLEDVMLLMAMSLIFGLVHIYIGLGIKGYTLLRDGDVMGFISDIVMWYIFITGVCLLVVPIVAGDIGVLADIGKYLAIIGAVGIILTAGRAFKGFARIFKGFSALYGITGYFGDVLSYTRLMALCLSSGVIGQVINLLGAMAGPLGIVVIGLIGHSINLFIGALGAYVHTSRLQFVEFFGKFYEGGGEAFTPFKFRTKYTNINEEEM